MDHVNLLRQTLKPHLKWHGARLSFMALFLIALFRVKTVNLSELATGFMGQTKTDSTVSLRSGGDLQTGDLNYKRLQRFLREFDLDYYELAKLIVGMMEIPEPWILSVDRTEWKFGRKTFNILTLGIVHQGVAFPRSVVEARARKVVLILPNELIYSTSLHYYFPNIKLLLSPQIESF